MQITNFDLASLLTPQSFVNFLHIMTKVLQVIYVLFAFMLTRQLKIMNLNFQTPRATFFKVLANINLIIAIGIVILSLLAL